MGTASFQFLGFGVVVALCYNLLKPVWWRQVVLLVANILFLASFSSSPMSFIPFAAFLLFGYASLWLIQSGRWNRLAPFLIGTILLFIWLKRYTFLPHATFLHFAYVTIGLSYIFFRVLHLQIAARDGDLPGKIDFLSYLNYTLNFATLISGPIQLYPDFAETHLAPQRPPLTIFDLGNAAHRIAIGFFKVEVLSMAFSALQQHEISRLSLTQPFPERVLTGALVAAVYPLFLYCNFSGYIDFVIGIAALMRFQLPENFNRPFASDNFMNFWNRWHITLSSWFKIYFYNPLLMKLMGRFSSKSAEPWLAVATFFITFFFIGIWHGQNSVFVAYGLLLGLGVSLNKLWQIRLIKPMGRKQYNAFANGVIYNAFARGLTFTYFTFSLFWFWSNWTQIGVFCRELGGPAIGAVWLIIFLGATAILSVWEWARNLLLAIRWNEVSVLNTRYARTVYITASIVITAAVVTLLNAPAPQIVYKTF